MWVTRAAAPPGLWPPAQGCEARATVGTGGNTWPNPNGVVVRQQWTRHNPVGVGNHLHVPTQGSPPGAGNLGLEDAAPLGLKFPVRIARN